MKILFTTFKYDNGMVKNGYSFEYYNFYDTLVKMDGGKHKVVYFPLETLREVGRDRMNEMLLETVRREKPDLCFFMIFTDEIKKETIEEITKNSGAITYSWFSDDQWRFDNYSKYWAPLFHFISTTDSQAPAKYKKIGYDNVIKTQWAVNHNVFRPQNVPLKYDATFIGQVHGNRGQMISAIKNNGVNVECWGNGWPRGRVSQDEMIRLICESRVNINLTRSSDILTIKGIAKIFINRRADNSYHLRSPLTWWDNIKSMSHKSGTQIKGRNFEIPGCGAFLLTGEADNLEEYYEDGKEIVIFKDVSDAAEKIKYYLAHDDERLRIARAGYEHTLREHTYEERFKKIFEAMGLKA